MFVRAFWGTGDNLTREDTKKGYDDYVMYECYGHTGKHPLASVMASIRRHEGFLDSV